MLIKNANIVLLNSIFECGSILISEGKILHAGKPLAPPLDCRVIDADGGYISPGFIDLHIHGLLGKSVDNGSDDFSQICTQLPRFGVTGFCPTFAPRKPGDDSDYLARMSNIRPDGAQILSFHLEGPFLSLTGALPPEALGSVDTTRIKRLINSTLPHNVIFSVAPEFDGLGELINVMRQSGCAIFMTHTAANVQQTLDAISAGATHATHFYNVFPHSVESDPGVRPCGAVEAILASPEVSVDFILDGEHVDPIAVKMALCCKGPDKVCLITDASPGAGAAPGKLMFCGQEVEIKYRGGPARQTSAGVLAGSGLTMDIAVRNAIKMLDVSLPMAVRMAAANPARVLGLNDRKGQIKKGYHADLVLLDKDLNVKKTWVSGKLVFEL